MSLDHSLEVFEDKHLPLIAAAKLAGVDTDQSVPGALRMIGYGETEQGYGPACILDLVYTDYVMEPHVTWFPWTGVKGKISNFKWAMTTMAESHQVLLNVQKSQMDFFEHFVKKGFLRKIGYIENLPIVEEIHMYQVKGD